MVILLFSRVGKRFEQLLFFFELLITHFRNLILSLLMHKWSDRRRLGLILMICTAFGLNHLTFWNFIDTWEKIVLSVFVEWVVVELICWCSVLILFVVEEIYGCSWFILLILLTQLVSCLKSSCLIWLTWLSLLFLNLFRRKRGENTIGWRVVFRNPVLNDYFVFWTLRLTSRTRVCLTIIDCTNNNFVAGWINLPKHISTHCSISFNTLSFFFFQHLILRGRLWLLLFVLHRFVFILLWYSFWDNLGKLRRSIRLVVETLFSCFFSQSLFLFLILFDKVGNTLICNSPALFGRYKLSHTRSKRRQLSSNRWRCVFLFLGNILTTLLCHPTLNKCLRHSFLSQLLLSNCLLRLSFFSLPLLLHNLFQVLFCCFFVILLAHMFGGFTLLNLIHLLGRWRRCEKVGLVALRGRVVSSNIGRDRLVGKQVGSGVAFLLHVWSNKLVKGVVSTYAHAKFYN